MHTNDSSYYLGLYLTAILELIPGDKVEVKTNYRLYADGDRRITFTGFLLDREENET
jgi:hypothetical protein